MSGESRPQIPTTVIAAIAAQAARTPDAAALVCDARHVSYLALMSRVDRWARALRRRGVATETVVAVHLPPSEALIVAVLAVLRAGGAYLPLGWGDPARRCRDIVERSGARLVIAETDHASGDGPRVTPDTLDVLDATDGPAAEPPALTGGQLAYVLYTSGSTGAPKGVAVEHAALLNHMAWMIAEFGAAAGARVLQRTSCAFDASVWELFFSLMIGGTLVIAGGDDSRDPRALRDLLLRETPSAMQCVPTFLRFAVEQRTLDGAPLAFVFVGGEPLPAALARDARRASGAAIVNLYGPTETTVDATWRREDDGCAEAEWVPIGRPIANVWAEPLSTDYGPVPDGERGELWIGGAGVARGYHRSPAATAAVFVPDPRPDGGGKRAYRTADLVSRRGGELTFAGRADRLIKLSGYRIELGEIEAALRRHPAVRDAIVRVDETPETPMLAAYCLPLGAAPGDDVLRSFLMELLPHYMIPRAVVWLDRFPVKPNGKLDLASLPSPHETVRAASARDDGESGASATEQALANILKDVLKRPVQASDNFFEIGGDSIRAIQLLSSAKMQGLAIKLQDIFETRSIAALAARVGPDAAAPAAPRAFELVPEPDRAGLDAARLEDAYPTTMLLDALYFLNETSARYEVYVTSCEVNAAWNPGAFRTALGRVVARHAWLRTSFAYGTFSRPLQLVHKDVTIDWTTDDLQTLPPAEQDARLHAWFDREKARTFDWGHAPVWRIGIHVRAADRFQLTLSEPIFDGWSVSSLLGELLADYAAACSGRTSPPRPRPRARYRDFVVAEQAALADPACVEFWQRKLAGHLGRALPRPGREALTPCGVRRLEIRLPADTSERLRAAGRRGSAPLKSVLLAAHARVLSTLTGRPKVVSGVIVNGRAERDESDQVLGLHINTVPMVIDLGGAPRWLDLIQRAFAEEREVLPYRRYPLAAIQSRHGRAPLFDAAFNFTHFHGMADALGAAGVRILRYLAWDQTFFPLTAQCHVDLNDATIGIGLDYDSNELSSAQMEEIAALYRVALDRIASDPESPIERPLWAPAVARVATSAPHAADAVPAFGTGAMGGDVLERFRSVVRERPDAVALENGRRQVSYAAMSQAVGALAACLAQDDVTERSVLVCVETQFDAAIAMLAILQAGGIYVPVDPAFPIARIAAIASGARAAHCVCDPAMARTLRDSGADSLRALRTIDAVAARPALAGDSRTPRLHGAAAYRIYTSGTTGTPKGVEVGHAALVHFLDAMRAAIGAGPRDVIPGITTIAFDISLLEMLLPLTIGARLAALPREVCRDGARLGAALVRLGATCCQATPTTWRLLFEAGAPLPRGLHAISGGEALSTDLAARLLAHGVTLTNAYGPTETTIWSATARIGTADHVTLGEPLGATTLRVVDAFGHECLPGVPGEILIGGEGVAHGYVGNPGLTAERFVPDPVRFAERCYRTGDVGRRTPDGSIEFLGRIDDQVKVRGYRIELGEIEHALRACPGVRAAVARVIGEERTAIAGYVIPDDPSAWDEDAVRRQLRQSLPEAMVPRHLMVVDAFPVTANHKVDRSRLPLPDAAPRTRRRVLELFEQVRTMRADDVKQALAGRA